MLDDGCSTVGCSLKQSQKDQDAQKLALLEKESHQQKCKAGNKNYCSGWSRIKDNISDTIDGLIWRVMPGGVGIDFGIAGQGGLVGEAGMTPIEIQILYNLRSKQLNILQGSGTFAYLGTPTFVGGNGYIGITTIYGASDNKYLTGPSRYAGITAAADLFGKAGINKLAGFSAKLENGIPLPFVDPVSNVPVTFRQTNLTGGGNLFPDGVDFGLFAGESVSEIKFSWP